MPSCDTHHSQLLEYLYDLLEADERQALEAHLGACPACQAELARVRGQQRLLAAAARMDFSGVHFTPPPAEATQDPLPTVAGPCPVSPSAPRTSRRRRTWWAAAAAVLLALGGLGSSGWWYAHSYRPAEQLVSQHQQRIAEANRQAREAIAALNQLPEERAEHERAISRAVQERQVRVEVVGPASVAAGSPAEYKVRTTNLDGAPADAEVNAQVMNGPVPVGKPVAVASAGQGVHRLTLPPDLPLPPGSQPTLVVSARRSGAELTLAQPFEVSRHVYVTHLATDKPMYQPGETVRFRSLTLDRATLVPAAEDLVLQFSFSNARVTDQVFLRGRTRVTNSSGVPVLGPDHVPLLGVGAGDLVLPEDAPGGEWTLTVREEHGRFPVQQRKFLVNRYQKHRLNKELDYNRKSYGPGDEVQARCKARRADGGPLANRPVLASVNVDGKRYGADGKESAEPMRFQTDAEGSVVVRFRLPTQIERGQASLTVEFNDGGGPESLIRPLPIVLKKLDVEFFPEGGDLVAGLPARVYFQVRTPLGRPADLKGRLLEDGKPLDVTAETLHDDREPGVNQGMGSFTFTPRAGHAYELKIESPVGIEGKDGRVPLPAVKAEGVVLSTPQGVFSATEKVPVVVHGDRPRNLLVGLYCRGQLIDSKQLGAIHFTGNTARTVLEPTGTDGGVCRVTVFEVPADGQAPRPLAERLVYRRPGKEVKLSLRPDRQSYLPRQHVTLGVEARTEKDEPAGAVVMLAVVDKSVLTLADDKTERTMPTHFLLTSEVRRAEDLEYADFLLGPQKRAAEALDLLLGTQGWRRFAEAHPGTAPQPAAEAPDRLMLAMGQSPARKTAEDREHLRKMRADLAAREARLAEEARSARETARQADEDENYKAALAVLAGQHRFFDQARRIGTPILGVLLLLAALLCLALGLARRLTRAVPYYAGVLSCAALLLLLVRAQFLVSPPQGDREERQVALAPQNAREQLQKQMKPEDSDDLQEEERRAGKANEGRAEWAGAGGAGAAPNGFGLAESKHPGKGGRPSGLPNTPMGTAIPPPSMPVGPRAAGQGAPALMKADRAGDGKDKEKAAIAKGEGKIAELRQLGEGADRARRAAHLANADHDAEAGKKKMAFQNIQRKEQAEFPRGAVPAAAPGRAFEARMPAPEKPPMAGVPHMDGKRAFFPYAPPLVVREYAHVWQGKDPSERSDFAETLCWQPVLVLPEGKANVSFQLGDSTTTFQVIAFAHTADGRLGAATGTVDCRLPLTLSPRVPAEVTASDRIDLPVSVSNNGSEERRVKVALRQHTHLKLLRGPESDTFAVPAGGTVRRLYRLQPVVKEGQAAVAFEGQAESFAADSVREAFRVVPEGFPITGSFSDVLEKAAVHTVVLPDDWIKGTLRCGVQVYPSTLADLQKGLEGLLREPNGCFEQTSTSNYPNLLILDYLRESNQAQPEVERRARELLGRGYQRLVSFECLNTGKNHREGYEWFGGTAPAHEALTAYGLMQFRDLARVQEVDPAMLSRTQDYLLSRRDGKGGFLRNPRALDTFGRAPDDVTNAYIVWSLTEGGKGDEVAKELNALAEQAKTSDDPYFLALVANALANRSRTGEATALLGKIARAQKDDGHLDATRTSITGSGGRDLQIETTALAVLGWLKVNPGAFNAPVRKAVRWIGQQRGGHGAFGSTQSTILSLKALIAYTRANKRTAQAGEIALFVGDRCVGRRSFAAGATETLALDVPGADALLRPGRNAVRVEISGDNVFPYTLAWSYQTLKPASAEGCPVRLATELAKSAVREGESVRLTVKLENVSGKGQGMAVAIVGLPGGLIVPEDMKQLKEYARTPEDGSRPLVSAFEIRGRELVLYWRDLAPGQKIEVPIDLLCRLPGEYSGPASRAYLYYNADHKHWVEPLRASIAARAD
jgi:anti-sigma factor RsiW